MLFAFSDFCDQIMALYKIPFPDYSTVPLDMFERNFELSDYFFMPSINQASNQARKLAVNQSINQSVSQSAYITVAAFDCLLNIPLGTN